MHLKRTVSNCDNNIHKQPTSQNCTNAELKNNSDSAKLQGLALSCVVNWSQNLKCSTPKCSLLFSLSTELCCEQQLMSCKEGSYPDPHVAFSNCTAQTLCLNSNSKDVRPLSTASAARAVSLDRQVQTNLRVCYGHQLCSNRCLRNSTHFDFSC